jgi:hypothetical protein
MRLDVQARMQREAPCVGGAAVVSLLLGLFPRRRLTMIDTPHRKCIAVQPDLHGMMLLLGDLTPISIYWFTR